MGLAEFGVFIKQVRKRKKQTQVSAGDEVGVSRATWNTWERGHSMPNRSSIRTLAAWAEVGESDLYALLGKPLGKAKKDNARFVVGERATIVHFEAHQLEALAAIAAIKGSTISDEVSRAVDKHIHCEAGKGVDELAGERLMSIKNNYAALQRIVEKGE